MSTGNPLAPTGALVWKSPEEVLCKRQLSQPLVQYTRRTVTGTPPARSLRCLISRVINQGLRKNFRDNLVFAVINKCFSKAEPYREHEAWMDPCRGDLLLLTDVKEDPVLDSTRNWAGRKNKNSKCLQF